MFKKAKKSSRKLRLAIAAPSGGGKTYSALRIATGIVAKEEGGRIAFIDTENNSAAIYSDKFDFDVVNINPPYLIQDFNAAILAAKEAGYPVLIIDSSSHAWKQVLDRVDKITQASKSKNSWSSWRQGNDIMDTFMQRVLYYPGHVIFCMRSKMEYIMTESDGKKSIEKMGLAPIMRNEIEYEFDMMLDGNTNHFFSVTKTRYDVFDGRIIEKPGEDFINELLSYIEIEPEPEPKPEPKFEPEPEPEPQPDNKKYNIESEPIDLSDAVVYDPTEQDSEFDNLYQKIVKGWNMLQYHDVHRVNSLKKYFKGATCLNQIKMKEDLELYLEVLRSEYKEKLGA